MGGRQTTEAPVTAGAVLQLQDPVSPLSLAVAIGISTQDAYGGDSRYCSFRTFALAVKR